MIDSVPAKALAAASKCWLSGGSMLIALMMAVSAAATSPPAAERHGFVSGNGLVQECGFPSTEPGFTFHDAYCSGYVTGAADGFFALEDTAEQRKTPIICVPRGVSQGQVVAIVKKYLIEHPAHLHEPASDLVSMALIDSFPCPGR